ncbi:hypothetical protein ACFE04_002823 [Oxalis oulophora]
MMVLALIILIDSTIVHPTKCRHTIRFLPKFSHHDNLPPQFHLDLGQTRLCPPRHVPQHHQFRYHRLSFDSLVTRAVHKVAQAQSILPLYFLLARHVFEISNAEVNPSADQLKICEYGSAKKLVPDEPNISLGSYPENFTPKSSTLRVKKQHIDQRNFFATLQNHLCHKEFLWSLKVLT